MGSALGALPACTGEDSTRVALGPSESATPGAAPGGDQLWVVGNWITTVDEYTGYLSVVNDLSGAERVEVSQAVELGGDMVYASPGGGVVFVGLESEPVIERWGLNAENALEKQDEVSLANFGVTSTLGGGRNVIQFVDERRVYYFDNENLQVIRFDPVAMATMGSFSLEGLEEEGQELGLNFIHRDGDRFILTARYWDLVSGTTTPLVRAAIVDLGSESVQYIDDTRCGDIAFDATDAEGNLYFGSHPGHAVFMAAGLDGDAPPPQCLLRILQGESRFDPDYFVDLTALSGGVVGGLLQGADNHAYVFQYLGEPINEENWQPGLRGDQWALHGLELGDEANTYAPVPGLGSVTAYGDAFTTVVNGERTPFVIAVDADFGSGRYYDASSPFDVVEALSFTGFPGPAIRVD